MWYLPAKSFDQGDRISTKFGIILIGYGYFRVELWAPFIKRYHFMGNLWALYVK